MTFVRKEHTVRIAFLTLCPLRADSCLTKVSIAGTAGGGMYEYHVTIATPVFESKPLAYSMAPRTTPTLVSCFANSGPPEQNGTTPTLAAGHPAETAGTPDYIRRRALRLSELAGTARVRSAPFDW